jgi:hypothetical protein
MRIWFVSLAILLMIGCSLGYPKEYLKGAITVDKMTGSGEIEAITFHFKEFPYNVTTGCHLSSENVDRVYGGPTRSVWQTNILWSERIYLGDRYSPFVFGGNIQNLSQSIERSVYINSLVQFCKSRSLYRFNELAKENKTTAITVYPKVIDNRTCTVLEYTGLMSSIFGNYWVIPTNVVGLFVPLNETKEGCDRYLILVSGNQTAGWLDSVKVSKTK